MLFYASLLLFCIAVSAIALWFYRSLYEIGKATYQAIFPSAKKSYRKKETATTILNPSLSQTATPWGWAGDGGARPAVPAAPETRHAPEQESPAPWGWKGGNHHPKSTTKRVVGEVSQAASSLKRSATNRKKTDDTVVGWPYRDEKFEFAGSEYKVTRKKRVKKTNMGGNSKPWGW